MFKKFNSSDRKGSNRNDRGGDRGFGRSEMFRTTCANCGNGCEVPFKPANGKPIYCRPCFQDMQDQDEFAPRFAGKSFNASSFEKYRGNDDKRLFDAECSMCGMDCQVPFKPMPGRPVYCATCMRKEDKMPMTGPKPMNAFAKNSDTGTSSSGPTKAEFAALTAKVDKILKLLESVMEDAEMDAEAEMDTGDFDDDFEDEEFEDMDEAMFEEEVEAPKKAPAKAKKTAAPKAAPAKKPTRGQVKRAKRTGKTL